MEKMIEISHVSKSFQTYRALDDVSLDIEKGKIYGIIGRNGSGKTVLFKCICGFLKTDSGEIKVDGKIIGKEIEAPQNAGIIIENPGFLSAYSGYQNLKFLADINKKIGKQEIRDVLEKVGLDPTIKKPVGKYSLGMRQRLGIAQAIMEHPKLLVLDEPMNGLDNNGVREMRELFITLKKEGTTILMATHSSDDVRELCDTVHEMDCGVISKRDDLNSFPTT